MHTSAVPLRAESHTATTPWCVYIYICVCVCVCIGTAYFGGGVNRKRESLMVDCKSIPCQLCPPVKQGVLGFNVKVGVGGGKTGQLWVTNNGSHTVTMLQHDVEITHGGVCTGRRVSLLLGCIIWWMDRERWGTNIMCPQTQSERGLKGPPPRGIFGPRTKSMMETMAKICRRPLQTRD